jgi:hypothetical protein
MKLKPADQTSYEIPRKYAKKIARLQDKIDPKARSYARLKLFRYVEKILKIDLSAATWAISGPRIAPKIVRIPEAGLLGDVPAPAKDNKS